MKRLGWLLAFVSVPVFADQVFLKDAGSIEGRIVEQTATTVSVDVGGGVVGVPMDRVERIQKGRCALDEYEDRARKLAPTDAAGWKKLGRYANDQGLSTQAQEAYKKVLKIAPNDAEANGALGLVNLDGRWVTEAESYRARGYVEYQGEWMTPAQAQVLQTEAANDQARRDAEQRARDAETAAREADARAEEAEERAKEAERAQTYYDPLYYGGWGYGVTSWPAAPVSTPKFATASQIRLKGATK